MSDKRIVLRYGSGERQGLYQIIGTEDQLKTDGHELPGRMENMPLFDHQATCIHAKTTARYHLYTELTEPQDLKDFHSAQR